MLPSREQLTAQLTGLVDVRLPFGPPVDWWRSPVGQVVAHRVGHPTAASVPYPVAGAMLGITRQGVHDLVTRGKLARHADGGVVPSSVRDRLRSRDDPAP